MTSTPNDARAPVTRLRSRLLDQLAVPHGFFTRQGGTSRAPYASLNCASNVGDESASVAENLGRAAQHLGFGGGDVVTVQQVHSTRVLAASRQARASIQGEQADGLITADRGLLMAIKTADCIPALVVDVQQRWAAAVHAGWRGLADGIFAATLQAFAERGIRPAELVVALGPHIKVCCYQVGDDVVDGLGSEARAQRDGRWHADMTAAAVARLTRAGVPSAAIEEVGPCCACDAGRFFSFRRDGGTTGRQLSAIALPFSGSLP